MERQGRHLGIDLMRVICMLMIVVYHIQGHGGLLISERLSPANQTLCYVLQTICQAAVNGYALISGYVGYAKPQRYSSLILLWLRVLFYSVGITGIAWLISPSSISYITIQSAFFPLLKGQYWYFTAYVGCFMLAPLTRAAIAHLPRSEARLCLGGILFIYAVLPYIFRNDPFLTSSGNHALWLFILFTLGAYFRKYDVFAKLELKRCVCLCIGTALIQASGSRILQALIQRLTGNVTTSWYFICNDSPTTLLLAISALALFSKLHPASFKTIIRPLAATSFSVYLIHDHPLVRQWIIPQLGAFLSGLPALLVLPSILLCAMLIYLFCTGIDSIREVLFRALRIRPLLSRAEALLMHHSADNDR